MNKMGRAPRIIMTDGEGVFKYSGFFERKQYKRQFLYLHKEFPIWFERMLRTCKDMFDKRIKPGEQCVAFIYPILLTYNKTWCVQRQELLHINLERLIHALQAF